MRGHIHIADRCFLDLARHISLNTLEEACATPGGWRPRVRLRRRDEDIVDLAVQIAAPLGAVPAAVQLDLTRRLRDGVRTLTGFRVATIEVALVPVRVRRKAPRTRPV